MSEYLGGPESRAGRIPTEYERSVDAMREAWKVPPAPDNSRPPATFSPPVFGPRPSNDQFSPVPMTGGRQGPVLSAGGLLVCLTVGAVLWENTSFLVAGALLAEIVAGGVVGTGMVWLASRLSSPGVKPTRMFGASFLCVCAYVASVYLLTRHAAWLLNPVTQGLQRMLGASSGFNSQDGGATEFAALFLASQIPALLIAAATLSLRLKSTFGGLGGYLRACVVSLLTLLIVGGTSILLARQMLIAR
jgi:hypothetical protein